MATIRKRTWTTGGEVRTAWVCDYFDQNQKRHLKTFKTRKAADAWMVGARSEVQQGIHSPASASVTIERACELWLDEAQGDGLEPGTVRTYREHANLHIKPIIGAVRLSELSVAAVADFRQKLIAMGRSRAMSKKVMTSLGAIIGTAQQRGLVAQNVVKLSAPRRRRQTGLEQRHKRRLEIGTDIPDRAEVRSMLNAARDWTRPLLILAALAGLRASELRGLRWPDLDMDAALLTVRQRADFAGTLGSPKSSAAQRQIPLPPFTISALKEWRLVCPRTDLDLVFPSPKGQPWGIKSIHRLALIPLQQKLGFCDGETPKYGLHSLRHFAASLFIDEGMSPKKVQTLLGHATISMTLDTYSHLFPQPEDDAAVMQRIAARLIG